MLYLIALSQPWKNRRHLKPYKPLFGKEGSGGGKGKAAAKHSAEDILRHFKREIGEVLEDAAT